jgi:hypothetical protein
MFRRPRVKAINRWKECRPLALAEVHWRPTGNRVLSRSFGEFMADGTIFAATQHQGGGTCKGIFELHVSACIGIVLS